MWSQTIHDLLPEPLLVCTCCSGQPRPALPQERDFTMKTPAVSAGCLQYKHSQGSQREVGWLWEQSGATRTAEQGTVTGVGGQFGSGADKQTPSAKAVSTTRNMVDRHTIGAYYKLYKRIRLHQYGDLQLQVLQVSNRHIMSFLLRWRCLSVLQHVMNIICRRH